LEKLTFIILAHRILLNRKVIHALNLVLCGHLNALYTQVEA